MMNVEQQITGLIAEALGKLFNVEATQEALSLAPTRKEFEGTYTFVTFPYLKASGKSPEETGRLIGEYLVSNGTVVARYNVVKGFLNLVVSDAVWVSTLQNLWQQGAEAFQQANKQPVRVMVEYSSPNTNKPLHLGHLRNNFLGYSISLILEAYGHDVQKVNLVNDRGIHICKSMLAYQKMGEGEQPSERLKGDKLVGNYYVLFDKMYKEQVSQLKAQYLQNHPDASEQAAQEWAEKEAPALKEAQEMLRKWEQGDPETVALWKKMNGWVYAGFQTTYELMGVSFDKMYYESDTYLLGKDVVEEGLSKGVFFRKEDGSVWIDLTEEGLDEKLLLRADGTSVYITQDMGTADMKYADYPMDLSIYVVGNEQDYHFKVLKAILQKLGRSYAGGIYHMSYGMVDLPSGKMKSREGNVVDADDLIHEMTETARERTRELGKIEGFTDQEANYLYHTLAMGALKYYLLRVDPKKRMLFNPEESIDFQGNTGVYIQYNHAKICALLRKAEQEGIPFQAEAYAGITAIHPLEAELIYQLMIYPDRLKEAATQLAPSAIANYAYDLSKTYSRFYSELTIFGESDSEKTSFRIALSYKTASLLRHALGLLGIEAPERM